MTYSGTIELQSLRCCIKIVTAIKIFVWSFVLYAAEVRELSCSNRWCPIPDIEKTADEKQKISNFTISSIHTINNTLYIVGEGSETAGLIPATLLTNSILKLGQAKKTVILKYTPLKNDAQDYTLDVVNTFPELHEARKHDVTNISMSGSSVDNFIISALIDNNIRIYEKHIHWYRPWLKPSLIEKHTFPSFSSNDYMIRSSNLDYWICNNQGCLFYNKNDKKIPLPLPKPAIVGEEPNNNNTTNKNTYWGVNENNIIKIFVTQNRWAENSIDPSTPYAPQNKNSLMLSSLKQLIPYTQTAACALGVQNNKPTIIHLQLNDETTKYSVLSLGTPENTIKIAVGMGVDDKPLLYALIKSKPLSIQVASIATLLTQAMLPVTVTQTILPQLAIKQQMQAAATGSSTHTITSPTQPTTTTTTTPSSEPTSPISAPVLPPPTITTVETPMPLPVATIAPRPSESIPFPHGYTILKDASYSDVLNNKKYIQSWYDDPAKQFLIADKNKFLYLDLLNRPANDKCFTLDKNKELCLIESKSGFLGDINLDFSNHDTTIEYVEKYKNSIYLFVKSRNNLNLYTRNIKDISKQLQNNSNRWKLSTSRSITDDTTILGIDREEPLPIGRTLVVRTGDCTFSVPFLSTFSIEVQQKNACEPFTLFAPFAEGVWTINTENTLQLALNSERNKPIEERKKPFSYSLPSALQFTKLIALSTKEGFALDTQKNVYAIHLPPYIPNNNNEALIKKLQYDDKDIDALNIIPLDRTDGKIGIITDETEPQILIVDPVMQAIKSTDERQSSASPQSTWTFNTFIRTNIWQPIKNFFSIFQRAWDAIQGIAIG